MSSLPSPNNHIMVCLCPTDMGEAKRLAKTLCDIVVVGRDEIHRIPKGYILHFFIPAENDTFYFREGLRVRVYDVWGEDAVAIDARRTDIKRGIYVPSSFKQVAQSYAPGDIADLFTATQIILKSMDRLNPTRDDAHLWDIRDQFGNRLTRDSFRQMFIIPLVFLYSNKDIVFRNPEADIDGTCSKIKKGLLEAFLGWVIMDVRPQTFLQVPINNSFQWIASVKSVPIAEIEAHENTVNKLISGIFACAIANVPMNVMLEYVNYIRCNAVNMLYRDY